MDERSTLVPAGEWVCAGCLVRIPEPASGMAGVAGGGPPTRFERARKAEESAKKRRVSTLKAALREHSEGLDEALADASDLIEELENQVKVLDVEGAATTLVGLQERRAALGLPPRPRKLSASVEERYRAYRDRFAELTARLEQAHQLWSDRADTQASVSSDDVARAALARNQKSLTDATGKWKAAISARLKGEEQRWSERVQRDNQRFYPMAAPLLLDLAAQRQTLGAVLAEMEAIRRQLFAEFAPDYEGYLRALDALNEGIDLDAALAWATDERTVLAAAEYLGISTKTLARRRRANRGPAYVRQGARIYYRQRDLDIYIDHHCSTGAAPSLIRFVDALSAGMEPIEAFMLATPTPDPQRREVA